MKDFPQELRHGSGALMTLDPTRLLIAFRAPIARADVAARIGEFALELEGGDEEGKSFPFEHVNHTDRRYWVRSRSRQPIEQERYDALQGSLGNLLAWIGPVYQLSGTEGRGGLLCPLPNVLLIKPAQRLQERPVGELAAAIDGERLPEIVREVKEKSAYLGEYRYFEISDPRQYNAYRLQAALLQQRGSIAEAQFENMPMLVPITATPNDTFFAQQWSMTRIRAGGAGMTGWDISTGDPGIIVCILDEGCDLTHPDLRFAPGAAGQGINLGTMLPTGAPTGPHGTACAGIAVGSYNNGAGVAGVAGSCSLMPVAFQNWTDVECAAGINWAANNGAHVISMSFGQYGPGEGRGPASWNFALIDPAIANAVNVRGCVLVAATGNENIGTLNRYPARHPLVIAVGGSDQADNRKSPASPDGECWGANFGPEISVVAPCVLNPTTDIQGAGGYNDNNGGAISWACVNYPASGDAAGDYVFLFNGTSSATPHVAGLAALLRSEYPTLTNVQVRAIIERTADKVGGVYADQAGFPNGTRTAQMGYGRINVLRALDFADSMIKDWTGDNGVEPSTPPGGNFWTFSDIVVRLFDDNVFDPGDPTRSSNVERGQTNYLYVRVTNNGAREARNVVVNARITPYVGTEFVYPNDWTAVDANHVSPTPVTASFAAIAAGSSVIAKFTISATQVDALWGWINGMNWHPCLLASVNADNDYAFATASTGANSVVLRRNNLAQRNLSVIDVLASASITFPFLVGNAFNAERFVEIVVDRSRLPKQMPLWLSLDDDNRAFPLADLSPRNTGAEDDEDQNHDHDDDDGMIFLERTKVAVTLGCCRGVLTLEKGSRFDCAAEAAIRLGEAKVTGGELMLRDGKRLVEIRDEISIIRVAKEAYQLYPLSLQTQIPANGEKGQQFHLSVAQRNEAGEVVGGANAVYIVK